MKTFFQDETFTLYCGDCRDVLPELPNECIDLTVTSPPYNVGIKYDSWNDLMGKSEYFDFFNTFVEEIYRVTRDDGRTAINILYEVNFKKQGEGRCNIAAEYIRYIEKNGFNPFGNVQLVEPSSERIKNTAWGSYLSPSCPYIYNADECMLLHYKNDKKKEDKNNTFKKIPPDLFQEIVKGKWYYKAETHGKTEANFSIDIPLKAIMALTYEEDVVLDPFIGSGTTAIACYRTNRKCIGIEISEKYCEIARDRYLLESSVQPLGIESQHVVQ